METPFPVVGAIDFGTHGTGYAWLEVTPENRLASQRNPHFRDRWAGTDRFYPKTLSALLLDSSGDVVEWGFPAKSRWNELSQEGQHQGYTYVSGFKMALKSDAYQGMTPPGMGATSIDSPAKAFPLVVAYLRHMYQTALQEIMASGYLESQIRWCVTIPAIWDEQEKQLMRDAAEQAGMPASHDRLILAIEPEVAALHCQVHMARVLGTQDQSMNAVDGAQRFMVVDCGGGTVDITAYRIERTAANEARFTEIGKVSGGKLGSEYINQAFIDTVLRDRLGGQEVIDRIRRECPHALNDLVEAWETAKVGAAVSLDDAGQPVFNRPVYVSIPGEVRDLLSQDALASLTARPPNTPNRIAIPPEECRQLFDMVIRNIVELVQEQLDEMAAKDGPPQGKERLLLVGGMSSSTYLQERLQQIFRERAMLMVPTDPAAAVLFGAVHYAYDPSAIRARRSRYTYGCDTATPFDHDRDPRDKLILDDAGQTLCRGRFQAFVQNGDTVEADAVTGRVFAPIYAEQRTVGFEFFRTIRRNPRYTDDPDCEQIGTATVDLGSAMDLPLEQRSVMVLMRFGQTEISVQGINMHTNQEVNTTLRFDTSY